MPQLPRYVADQGLDVARAPDLALDNSVGQALTQFGATGQDVALKWQQIGQQKNRFRAEQELIRLSSDLDQVDEVDAQKMQPDGTGWRESRSTAFTTRRDAFLNVIPEDLREEFGERARTLGNSYLNRASGRELKAMGDFSLQGLDTASNNLLQRTSANPENRKDAEATMRALIESAPGIARAEKDKLLAAVPGRFDEAAAFSMVDSGDYDGALGVTGGAGYLETLRGRESGGDDAAKAGTSSATGRYQFISDTWNRIATSSAGKAAGLQPIGATAEDPRLDPVQQETAVRLLTAGNARAVTAAGFQPTERNLYLAHFMGDGGAVSMLKAINADPDQSAAALFPDAAKANKRLFYDRDGNARTVEDAYGVITRNFSSKAPDAKDMDLTQIASPDWGRQSQLRRQVTAMIEGREADKRRLTTEEAAAAKAARAGELAKITVGINDVANGVADPGTLAAYERRLYEIGKEIGLEDVQTELTALGDARAKAGGEAQGDTLASIAVRINDVANGAADVATLDPIEGQLNAIGKSAGAKAVEAQLKALGDARAKAGKNSASMADVAKRLSEGGLDATNADDRKFFDMLYTSREAPALAKMQPADRNAKIAALAGRAGIVPDSLIQSVNGTLMAGQPERQLEAADLVDKLGVTNRALTGQFSKDAERKAGLINFFRRYGDPDPVGKAVEALKVDPATVEARDRAFADDAKEKGPQVAASALEALVNDDEAGFGGGRSVMGIGVAAPIAPVEMTADFNRAVQEEFRLTGNMPMAVDAAKREIGSVWGRSAFAGDDEIVAYPPEKFFGRPDMDIDDNAAWMREQAEADVASLGASLGGADPKGRLEVMRHPYATGTDGLPVYVLVLKGDDNAAGDGMGLYPIRGKDGQLLTWRPDWDKSPEAARRAKVYDEKVALLRQKREGKIPQIGLLEGTQ